MFITLNFGLLYKVSTLPQLSGQHLDAQWQGVLQTPISIGNKMHDELYDGQGLDVTVEDAISAVGNHSQVRGVMHEYNIFGANPVGQLEAIVQSLLHCTSCH